MNLKDYIGEATANDKKSVLELARKGNDIQRPQDIEAEEGRRGKERR